MPAILDRHGMPLEGAIFDVDGVLVASPHEQAWRESLQDLMATRWKDILPSTRYTTNAFTSLVYQELVAGRPRLGGATAALTYSGVPDVAHRALEYAEHKQRRLLELIAAGEFAAFPDGVRFALALRAMGVRLAAASSSKNAWGLLQRIHLDPYRAADAATAPAAPAPATLADLFDVDVSGRDLDRGKPYPDIFLLAAAELQTPPKACLVVEDAPSGIQAAKAGKMLAVGVARAGDAALLCAAGADIVVASLDDVDVGALMADLPERTGMGTQVSRH